MLKQEGNRERGMETAKQGKKMMEKEGGKQWVEGIEESVKRPK